MKPEERYQFRGGKVVMRCPECLKEHLRDPQVVFVGRKRFTCVNGCRTVLEPKDRY